jgi:hypothetical protein
MNPPLHPEDEEEEETEGTEETETTAGGVKTPEAEAPSKRAKAAKKR